MMISSWLGNIINFKQSFSIKWWVVIDHWRFFQTLFSEDGKSNYSKTSKKFLWLFVLSYVDWIPLQRKRLKENFEIGFHKFFKNFRKNRIFQFSQKMVKIRFLVKFDLKLGKSIKNKGDKLIRFIFEKN